MILHPNRTSGFTIIELIMVIVVLGALSVFIAPRFSSQSSFDSLSFHQELKTAIRYAHKLSIASGCEVQVALTANSYSLFSPNNTCNPPDAYGANPLKHPVQSGSYSGTAPTGVSITGFSDFYFKANGAPEPNSSVTLTINPDARTIKVNAMTGYVQ